MNLFKNLKIAQKLTVYFLIATVLMGVIGFIGLSNMKKISDNAISMHDDNLKPSNHINAIKGDLLETYADMLIILDEMNKDDVQAIEDNINAIINDNENHITQLEGTMPSLEEEKLYEEIKSEIQEYINLSSKAIELVNNNDYIEAQSVFQSNAESRDNMFSNIDKLIELKMKNAMENNDKNIMIYKSSSVIMISIIIIGLFIAMVMGTLISVLISKQVKKIDLFAKSLGEGDFTHTLNIESKDEMGSIAKALNRSCSNINELVSEIIKGSNAVSLESREMSGITQKVSFEMDNIDESIEQISKGAEELSASTQEVSASTQEIEAVTLQLEIKAKEADMSSKEIKERALNIKENVTKAIEDGNAVYNEKQSNIIQAIEAGKVVEQVKIMAESIGNIASQTNLLALNASIEAARAGEQGRGFSIVAEQIKDLAGQSAHAVLNIQEVVNKVQVAFDSLSKSGQDILDFMQNNVKPNYEMLIETGSYYEKDAEFINNMAEEISCAINKMSKNMELVSCAVQSVSSTAQESATGSEEIRNNVNDVTLAMENVAKSAQNQAELAERLNSLLIRFKII